MYSIVYYYILKADVLYVFVLERFSTLPKKWQGPKKWPPANTKTKTKKTKTVYRYNIAALPCWKRKRYDARLADCENNNKRGKDKNIFKKMKRKKKNKFTLSRPGQHSIDSQPPVRKRNTIPVCGFRRCCCCCVLRNKQKKKNCLFKLITWWKF